MNETFIYTYVLMIYKITISAKGHPEMLGQPLFPVVVWFWTVWATSCKFFQVSMCTAGPQAYC
jgi:hypothetical protein